MATDQVSVELLVDGRWQPAAGGGVVELLDPATEERVGAIAQATREDAERAIEAAARAFEGWRRVPAWERAKVLRKAAALLAERSDAVARRMTLETGKPLAQAKGEVLAAAETIDWFADEARRIHGETLPGRTARQRFMTIREPVGPVAAFTAWNFPVVLQARKIAPALAAGCTVVCRPAEEGTGAVALMVRCFVEAGAPDGVVNMLSGVPGEIAETVMDSDLIRKVSFTGSIPVGQHLIRRSADTVKRMSMELGGHAPVVVHEDADPLLAAKAAAVGKFRNNGQVCVSPTRFYVHERVKDAFARCFVDTVKGMRLGHGLDPETDIGPLVNRWRLEAVERMVEDTKTSGAALLCGGRRPAGRPQPRLLLRAHGVRRRARQSPRHERRAFRPDRRAGHVRELRRRHCPRQRAALRARRLRVHQLARPGPGDGGGAEDRHRRRQHLRRRHGRDAVRRRQALGLRARERRTGHRRLPRHQVHQRRATG
jgi:succinate-semialdehyde dehydrogenase/glutarate-semialdehyde dehydrogenase